MEIYFKRLQLLGDLFLEHVFYEYEEPILFVCQGNNGKRYLCSCCRLSEQWLLAEVSEDDLIDLINEKVTIGSLFMPNGRCVFMLLWDKKSFTIKSKNIPLGLIPDDKKLELFDEETRLYKESLKNTGNQDKRDTINEKLFSKTYSMSRVFDICLIMDGEYMEYSGQKPKLEDKINYFEITVSEKDREMPYEDMPLNSLPYVVA